LHGYQSEHGEQLLGLPKPSKSPGERKAAALPCILFCTYSRKESIAFTQL